jgi:soluble lytic murein transglycosylase-like protein
MRGTHRWWPLRGAAIPAIPIAIAVAATLVLGSAIFLHRDAPARAKPAAAPAQHSAISPRKIATRKPDVASPSDFDKEQQMSFAQLMKRWDPLIAQASKRFGVPPPWIHAVMQIESGGRTMSGEKQPIISSAGAMGLMQLMPSTYEDMRAQYGLGADPYAPRDNILAGAAYLRWLHGRYGYPAMFAAYNDGPGNLEERLLRGGLLPIETRNYLSSIAGTLETGHSGHRNPAKFTRPDGVPIWIDAAAAVSVRAALPGEYAPGVLSVITIGKIRQGVRENVATAKATIRAHGGWV